ncbi:MAG: 50S ribosomal protein L19 [Saprospiraceae bacterium]|nr:50S ribosomal protein L19 [Saprospiraceae bacterium]
MDAIKFVQEEMMKKPDFPPFAPGDNIIVTYKIIEGEKERSQSFKGDVIKISGDGLGKTFTVRKISNGVGVERIWPMASPNITEILIVKRGKVRRAKLYYLRGLVGKKARIKEKEIRIKNFPNR